MERAQRAQPLSPSPAATGEGSGWGQLDLAFARRDGATRSPASTRRPRSAPSSRATNAATSPSPPWPMSAAAWSPATPPRSRSTIGEGAAAMVTSQAAEKVYRSTGADCRVEHPPARRSRRLARMVPAGDHPVRPLPPAALAAPGPSLWRAGDARRDRGARPAGLGRAREPGPAARPHRRLPGAAARLDRSISAWREATPACWPRSPGSAVPWRWQPSSMPRPMPRALVELGPRSRRRRRRPGRRHHSSTASCSPASWPRTRLRCGAHSHCSGPASARPPPGSRPSCRGSGMSEGTPCI